MIAMMLLAGTAAASPSAMVTPPAGWTPDPEQAATIAQKVQAVKHLGGAPVVVAAEAYVPKPGNVALIVTRVSTEAWSSREAAARAEIEDLHAPKAYDWRELPADDRKLVGARGEWADTVAGTQTIGTVILAASDKKLVAVRGECFSADKASGDDVNACTQALFSLDPGIPVAERIVFAAATPAAQPAPVPAHDDLKLSEPSRLTDGQDVHLAPISIAQSKPAADRRPIYLGAGIVVLAAVFWWNRRRREQFERADQGETKERRQRRARRDDDADDLAAAARGDGRKDDEA